MNNSSQLTPPADWLRVGVGNLMTEPGLTGRFEGSGTIEGLRAGLAEVEHGEPVAVRVELLSTAQGIRVTGRVSGKLTLGCARCLVEFIRELDIGLKEDFYFDPALAEAREGYEVEDQTVDLEPMVRDAIVLSIPMQPVHDPKCRGLCAVCGADLNVTDCGHAEMKVDLRWAPLKGLIGGESGSSEE